MIATGCGGAGADDAGDNAYNVVADTTVTTANLAKARYVPRVNKICRKAWVVILDNFAQYSGWQDQKEPAKKRFIDAVQLSLTAGIDFHIFDNIYDLGAPRGEEREMEEIIGTMQSAVERAQKGLAPVASVGQVAKLFGEYNRRAAAYGLDECLVDQARLRALEA